MIGRVLDALAGRVAAADAVVKSDDTLSLSISPEGDTRVSGSRSQICHLRVARQGRIGFASTEDETSDLVGRAMASAASGEELELFLPAAAPLPVVVTRAPQAAAADTAVLAALARSLRQRLTRSHRRVEVWAERSAGAVQVANTRSVLAGYDATMAGLGAVVESIDAEGAPPCRVHWSAASLPALPDIEALVAEVDRRLDPPVVSAQLPAGSETPVCLGPRAVATLLRPLKAALTGYEAWLGRSPLRDLLGERVFSETLSLTDDPLAPARPGSRPVDDDGVVSRRVSLVERGRLASFASDLMVGAKAQVPSTGHAWRVPHSAPRVGLTNLRIEPGTESRESLLAGMGRGVLVEDLEWGRGPSSLDGTIALRAPWAYLVEKGSVRGRLEGALLSGNAFAALKRIQAVGADQTWIGAQCLCSMVVEGLRVSLP